MGLTQQMNAFHSLGSSPPTNNCPTTTDNTSFLTGHQFRQPVVTVTSPEFATVDLTRPSSFSVEDLSAGQVMSVEMGEPCSGMPITVRRSLIDRVRAEPQDDNQENCIQICKEILTRSTSISCPSNSFEGVTPARRGSVKSCSPLAVTEGISRSLTPSSSSSSSSSSESTPQVFQRLQRQGSSSTAQVHSNNNNNGSISSVMNSLRSEASSAFPPTPPSEDMML